MDRIYFHSESDLPACRTLHPQPHPKHIKNTFNNNGTP